MLAMKSRQGNGPWFRVRERKNHREFPGNYIVCNSVQYGRPEWCHYGEESCSFAHNLIEQRLWTVEKDGGQFNVTEFIMQNRSSSKNRGFSLAEILSKHGGNFDFICRNCYFSRPPRISGSGGNGFCNGMFKHPWQPCSILTHFGPDGAITVINNRSFTHKTAFFKICKWLHFCKNSASGMCRFAHSLVERDVWMLERDTGMTRLQIVQEASKHFGQMYSPQPPPDVKKPTPPPAGSQTRSSATPPPSNLGHPDCPFNVQAICGICWRNGQRSLQDGTKDRCTKQHNLWTQIRIFQVLPSMKEIRPLPRKIPLNFNFIICKYIREKKRCDYSLGGPCQFAHGEEELEIWKWMCKYNQKTLEELAEVSRKSQIARAPKPAISQGESVVAVQKAVARVVAPSDLNYNPHYCQYCGVQCNSEKQWDNHCASEKHTFNVNSDRDHQWNHRQPPWGIPSSSYELCARHVNGERCQYSHVPDMYNLCNLAHSEEELDEWRERYEWRQMKREMAKAQKVFSYMDQLLEKYENSDSAIEVMSEEVDGVTITQPMEPLNVYREDKHASLVWSFVIKSVQPLQKVALLYNRDRLHFAIQTPDKEQQIAPGDMFEDTDSQGMLCYRVNIRFTGGMFGSFSQWVIFDFGTEPVIVRKLSVEVGHQVVHEKVHHLRQKLSFDRWTSLNREIIRQGNSGDAFSEQLLRKYKEPNSSEQVVTQNSIIAELNRNNYVHKMHKLLELEEMTRHQIISSYNLCTEVEIINQIEDKCSIYPRQGELFARVHLSENLTEDTHAGKLILTSVRKVLLAPVNNSKKTVYEVNIVREENFNYDGRGKEYLYLCLPPVCVSELKVFPEMKIDLEIQFQMNRLQFCRMHYAIDCLQNTDIVFPDIVQLNPEWNERQVLKISSKILNDDQMAAVRHIVTERTGYTPPFIMYGPFGTGKTETLAQAAMVLLKERKESRILICAQSNSAADLYIMKHLDPFLKKASSQIKLRRVYVKERRVNTVPPDVQKYCIFTPDRSAFEFPTKEDIMDHRVVITTVETALQLSKLGLQGYFTHIFVDEAAQVLESEVIMPLSLSTQKTCIILTGDHMQTSPKVYSAEARRLNFHISLLDRLYQYYEHFSKRIQNKTNNPLNIFLSINYRTKMEILRFISAIFYGGPDTLKAMGNVPSVVELTPLVFHAVQGREVQDSDSTSYYNMSEVEEIVERVEELYDNWPIEWGERSPQEIEVVTPYYDQVVLIRHMLRKRRHELRRISVDTVHNIQGKEFRALFISTCRTSHLLESSHLDTLLQSSECDGDIGNFGFLSDPKLLNTALTRAKSYVSVVGDPVALCAIGECVQVWRTYLKHCANMKSLHPHTLSYESIKSRVHDLQISPLGQKLMEITEMSRSASTAQRIPRDRVKNDSSQKAWQQMTKQQNSTVQKQPVLQKTVHPSVPSLSQPQPLRPLASNGFMGGQPPPLKQLPKPLNTTESSERSTESDEIMRQLVSEGGNDGELMIECIRVREDEGHAVVEYDPSWPEERRQMMMQIGSDDLEGVEADYLDGGQGGPRKVLRNYDETHLYNLLQSKPDRYKHCVLHIESTKNMFARVVDPLSTLHQIKISTRKHCGQAFNKDEVVVEIMDPEEEHVEVHGQVVGLIRREVTPTSIPLVCTVEASNTGVLIPLNKGIPRIYNLTTLTSIEIAKSGNVCVYHYRDKKIELKGFEQVDPSDPSSKLFVVRYLTWDPSFHLPFGIVVGVLPAGRTVETGMKVLDTEYHIPQQYKKDTEEEIKRMYGSNYHMPQEVSARSDLRDKWCFTLDTPAAQDVDDAFSIEQTANGMYEVAVHISDVAFFLLRESNVDLEAMQRGTSFYPIGRTPLHMLPPKLSQELCSIHPNVDRLSISVFMTVNGSGEITKVDFRKCVINCKRRFSFEEAEEILKNPEGAQTDYFTSCMVVLYQVALLWRRNRLGNDSLYQKLEPADILTPKSHLLKQELMIAANHQVAIKLIKTYPKTTPLICQSPLNQHEAEEWKEKHAADAINTVALTKPFLEGNRTCKCRVACTCIFTFIRQRGVQAQGTFDILKTLWRRLCSEADVGHYDFVQHMIVAPENHPQLAMAQAELSRIQEESQYGCSGDLDISRQGNYSLNVSSFVSFTSPLSNYMDVVVQRLLSAVIDHLSSPYSKQDIQNLCHLGNNAVRKSRDYHKAVFSLNLAGALLQKPLVAFPVVEKVDDESMSLVIPAVKDITAEDSSVDMSLLGPSDKPEVSDNPVEVKVKWQERIYDTAGVDVTQLQDRVKELNPDKFVYMVPAFHWQRLLNAIREEDSGKLETMVTAVREQVDNMVPDGHFAEDVSSESSKNRNVNHFVDFTLKMHQSMVMRVQVTAEVTQALLKPKLQLLNLTPRLDTCLEHRNSPQSCFANCSPKPASKPTYSSEVDYQTNWLPVLHMESASRAVAAQESLIIHNVSIEWKSLPSSSNPNSYIGHMRLPLMFFKEREIKFVGDIRFEDLLNSPQLAQSYIQDFICVRYTGLQLPQDVNLPESISSVYDTESVTWVGHCCIQGVLLENENVLKFNLELQHSSTPMPDTVLRSGGKTLMSTIEWIPQTALDRQRIFAVQSLAEASTLAKNIATGKKHADINRYGDTQMLMKTQVESLSVDNPSQQEALMEGLREPFTVIQGPPGSGKTVLGAKLAYLLCQRNRSSSSQPPAQVLICGPTNKSLDVFAAYLLGIGANCPRLVRVYSERKERCTYPLPHDPVAPKKRKPPEAAMDPLIKNIALHELIRQPSNVYSQQIQEMDTIFGLYRDDITEDQVREYMALVAAAVRVELQQAEIILTTCAASASPKMSWGTNIHQVIIDECGMCTEPEAMIPIVKFGDLKQVILIGDKNQLQPIITQQSTKELGLGNSLLERYSARAIKLTKQYRMHEGIAEFPTRYFYSDCMECGKSSQLSPSSLPFWPKGKASPVVFCHVAGVEDIQSPLFEGSEKPHVNEREVHYAVTVATTLVNKYRVSESDIVVLSQYRAQCLAIQKKLQLKGLRKIAVCTVLDSQGREWDYVILSTVRSIPQSQIEPCPTRGWLRRNLWALSDKHQVNVAITRACKGLVIIGNKFLLSCNPVWRDLLQDYSLQHKLLEAEDFLRLMM